MDYLKQKSEFNFSAAEILTKNSLFSPSIHCAYYSCFQLIKHIIYEYFEMDYEAQKVAYDKSPRYGSHNFFIKKVLETIKNNDRLEYIEINRKIKELKLLREQSDYQNIEITFDQSDTAISYTKYIRSYLTTKML